MREEKKRAKLFSQEKSGSASFLDRSGGGWSPIGKLRRWKAGRCKRIEGSPGYQQQASNWLQQQTTSYQ